MSETYLGDAVYASFDGWQIALRCANPSCVIYLEPEVFSALLEFAQRIRESRQVQEQKAMTPNPKPTPLSAEALQHIRKGLAVGYGYHTEIIARLLATIDALSPQPKATDDAAIEAAKIIQRIFGDARIADAVLAARYLKEAGLFENSQGDKNE